MDYMQLMVVRLLAPRKKAGIHFPRGERRELLARDMNKILSAACLLIWTFSCCVSKQCNNCLFFTLNGIAEYPDI